MLKTRVDVAKAVGMPLIEMEQHIDAALALQATVMTAAIEGRRRARLPLHTGQDALELIAAASASMLAARKAVHEAHLLFRGVQDGMGVGTVSYGDYGDTPREEPKRTERGNASLTVVQAA